MPVNGSTGRVRACAKKSGGRSSEAACFEHARHFARANHPGTLLDTLTAEQLQTEWLPIYGGVAMRKKLALLGLCGGAVLAATAIATIAKADDLPDNRYRDQDGRVDCKY
jgi:hypothetical protein